MKRLIVDDKSEGLTKLIGERVTLFCANYFYAGTLLGVSKTCVLLGDPSIIYETGPFPDTAYKDEQKLGVKEWYVRIPAIESFGILK